MLLVEKLVVSSSEIGNVFWYVQRLTLSNLFKRGESKSMPNWNLRNMSRTPEFHSLELDEI